MKAQSFRFVCVALTAVAVSGCQSGSRWAQMPQKLAWWKKDAPAVADNSLVARSAEGVTPAEPAAPVLPSTQATPQSLTAQATPPSANSVAAPATGIATANVPPISSTIPASSAATIAAAPTATYPSAIASVPTTATTPLAPPSASAVAATTPVAAPSTTVAQVGPYDPNAYQVAAAVPAAQTVATTQSSSTESDRYGTSTAPAAEERYAYNAAPTAPATSPTADDRYGITKAAPATAPAATIPPATTAPAPPAYSVPPITPVGMNTTPAPTNTVAAAAVRIDAPAGQYRPGGTSTYTGAPTTNVEVASLPVATTPGTSTKPLPSNVPIYPAGNTTGRAY